MYILLKHVGPEKRCETSKLDQILGKVETTDLRITVILSLLYTRTGSVLHLP